MVHAFNHKYHVLAMVETHSSILINIFSKERSKQCARTHMCGWMDNGPGPVSRTSQQQYTHSTITRHFNQRLRASRERCGHMPNNNIFKIRML